MYIKIDINLRNFDFWGSAKTNVRYLRASEIDLIQRYIEEINDPFEVWTATEINDFFGFETDWIAKFLGYENFDELMEERK